MRSSTPVSDQLSDKSSQLIWIYIAAFVSSFPFAFPSSLSFLFSVSLSFSFPFHCSPQFHFSLSSRDISSHLDLRLSNRRKTISFTQQTISAKICQCRSPDAPCGPDNAPTDYALNFSHTSQSLRQNDRRSPGHRRRQCLCSGRIGNSHRIDVRR